MRQYQAYESKREHMMEFISFGPKAGRASMVQSVSKRSKMDLDAPTGRGRSVWRFSIPNSEPLSGSSLSMTLVRLSKA
jgi:hypothetical protein